MGSGVDKYEAGCKEPVEEAKAKAPTPTILHLRHLIPVPELLVACQPLYKPLFPRNLHHPYSITAAESTVRTPPVAKCRSLETEPDPSLAPFSGSDIARYLRGGGG